MKPFRLDYDPDYGIDHRTGWTVHYDGCVLVQFAKGPLRALWRAWWKWREMERDRYFEELGEEMCLNEGRIHSKENP